MQIFVKKKKKKHKIADLESATLGNALSSARYKRGRSKILTGSHTDNKNTNVNEARCP